MENKIIEEIGINARIDDIQFVNDTLVIKYKDEFIKISCYYEQDCCEDVYADFSPINDVLSKIKNKYLKYLTIKAVSGDGFLLCFEEKIKVFIPCYNSQNGYYSKKLDLTINLNGYIKRIDITECVKDKILKKYKKYKK